MERKATSIQPVERLERISPVVPIRSFKPLPDQSELRKKNRLKNQQLTNESENRANRKAGSIDLKA